MNYQRPAYEQVTLEHCGNIVTLRPSLRAAATLEARYGLPALDRALNDLSFTIISEIILAASSPAQDAAAFLSLVSGRPLFPFLMAVRRPLDQLISMFEPAPDPKAKPSTSSGAVMSWAEVYRDLYRFATGALGWTPEAAWNATPTEINEALIGKYGTGDDKQANEPDPEQAAQNIAAGLDPEFDRAGLRALKAKIAGGA